MRKTKTNTKKAVAVWIPFVNEKIIKFFQGKIGCDIIVLHKDMAVRLVEEIDYNTYKEMEKQFPIFGTIHLDKLRRKVLEDKTLTSASVRKCINGCCCYTADLKIVSDGFTDELFKVYDEIIIPEDVVMRLFHREFLFSDERVKFVESILC
jgi:hypothetical protein